MTSRNFRKLSFALSSIIAASSLNLAPRPALASEQAFSGCRGDGPLSRCCSRDFTPGNSSGNFERLANQTDFGRQCIAQSGYIYVSSDSCSIRTQSHGTYRNQTQIRCELPLSGARISGTGGSSGSGLRPSIPADPCIPVSPPARVSTSFVPVLTHVLSNSSGFPGPIAGIVGQSYLDTTVQTNPFFGAGTYLEYGFMGRGPNPWTIANLRSAARLGTTMQIGFEPYADMSADEIAELRATGLLSEEFALHRASTNSVEFTLPQIREAMLGRGNLDTAGTNARTSARNNLLNHFYNGLVSWADVLHGFNLPILLRPMSEMNDATARWQLSSKQSKSLEARPGEVTARAQIYADVWSMIYDLFQARSATNVKFLFIPLVHQDNRTDSSAEGTRAALEALKRIDPAKIDAIGLNVYTSQYATSAQLQNNSFASLTKGWLRWLRSVPGYSDKPLTVGEMGVGQVSRSTGGENPEANRIKWIRDAFASAKQQGFSMATYFDSDNSACVSDACTEALARSVKAFQQP